MKKYRWVLLGIVSLLAVAGMSYFWATGLMDSLYAYRSPLSSSPVAAGRPLGEPVSRRVVMILVDALRVDTAANAALMPTLNQLRAAGASATVHSRTPSYSFQGWTTLLTGGWQELSDGPAMNPAEGESAWTWTQDNVFSAVHAIGMKNAYAGTHYFTEVIPAAALDASFIVESETVENDALSAAEAVKFIQSGEYAFVLLHINQVDWAGHHEGGPRDLRWNEAATRADALIAQVLAALDLSQDTIMIVSDHGQIDAGGHGGQDAIVLVEPFVMAGAAVRPGAYGDIDQTDVAPTITTLLGANLPAISQGHALSGMLNLSETQLLTLTQASILQQKTLYEAYSRAMNVEPVEIQSSPDHFPVTIYQSAMENIKTGRLNSERIPRLILAGMIVLALGFFLFKNHGQTLGWMLASTAIYLAVFHLIYGLLQGRTYSLSSVLSSGDIINTAALDTALALIIAWLVLFTALRLATLPPLQATHTHLAFTGIALLIVALPALWGFAWNGAIVTWTLPEMASTFLAFLSILQLLIMAAVGLLLTGLTSLLSFLYQRNGRSK